jgi:hypothetical protein
MLDGFEDQVTAVGILKWMRCDRESFRRVLHLPRDPFICPESLIQKAYFFIFITGYLPESNAAILRKMRKIRVPEGIIAVDDCSVSVKNTDAAVHFIQYSFV